MFSHFDGIMQWSSEEIEVAANDQGLYKRFLYIFS